MNKVADYLQGHILGEVVTRNDVRDALSTDMGVLRIKPEMVIYPRNTNDVRKVCRFAWQLAEKGHAMSVTVRGGGLDATGAALGKGASLVTVAHLNKIYEYDAKQRLVRLQPGVTVAALNQALGLYGTAIPALYGAHSQGTIGGGIGNAIAGPLAGKYGTIERCIEQLEVVLANGDVIQTGRISRRELDKRKGQQGFEGDLYRGIDGILEEYADVLDTLRANDGTGYNTIADVKQKDGSFDLTPLFAGSQGTLGIVTEMILRAEYVGDYMGVAAIVFASANAARDALDSLSNLSPALLDYFDAELFESAAKRGKKYPFYSEAAAKFTPESVVLVGFDDMSEKARNKRLKKVTKLFEKYDDVVCVTGNDEAGEALLSARDVAYFTEVSEDNADASPRIFDGFYIPTERLEDFANALPVLAKKHHVGLPIAGHAYTNIYTVYPTLQLKKVGDKQKVFKLLEDVTKLVYEHSGTMVAEGGEGRLKTKMIYGQLDEKVLEMYAEVRKVCDPFGTLNAGVKQPSDLKHLAEALRDDFEAGQMARFGI